MLRLPQSVALFPHVQDVALALLQRRQRQRRVSQAAAFYGGAILLRQLVQEGHGRVGREAGRPGGSGLIGVEAETGHTLQSYARFTNSQFSQVDDIKCSYISSVKTNPLLQMT